VDSIYFIEFKVDNKFIEFLNDIELPYPKKLTDNLIFLTRNRNFVTLVRTELKVRRLSRVAAYQKKQTELMSLGNIKKKVLKTLSTVSVFGAQPVDFLRMHHPTIVE
jgi:hypothetical protein